MKKLIAATAVSLIIASPAYALTTDYDDGAAQFWASLAESSSNANDYVMFSWLADSAELKMTDEKVQAALEVSDEVDANEIPKVEKEIDIEANVGIESNFAFQVVGDSSIPEELAQYGIAKQKAYITETYSYICDCKEGYTHVTDTTVWAVKPHESLLNQMVGYFVNDKTMVFVANVDGSYKMLGHSNYFSDSADQMEFVSGSEYEIGVHTLNYRTTYGGVYLEPYNSDDDGLWNNMGQWLNNAIQEVSEPTIEIQQVHTGYNVEVKSGEKVLATTFTELGNETLEGVLDLISDVAEQAYEEGYKDGFEDGYEQGYSDGFADGVNSVKDQLQ